MGVAVSIAGIYTIKYKGREQIIGDRFMIGKGHTHIDSGSRCGFYNVDKFQSLVSHESYTYDRKLVTKPLVHVIVIYPLAHP